MGRKTENVKGKKFGYLTAVRRTKNSANGRVQWRCRCICGNYYTAELRHLKSGAVKSCGCIKRGAPSKEELSNRLLQRKSSSLARVEHDKGDPYKNLAHAIVAVAVDDYRDALKDRDDGQLTALERFFHSEWYQLLTNVSAEHLLMVLRRENDNPSKVINI